MNSKGNVFWGIFLLVAAAFIVVGNMGLFGDISFWTIGFSIVLLAWFVRSLFKVRFGGMLFSLAFAAILFDEVLNIEDITPWPVRIGNKVGGQLVDEQVSDDEIFKCEMAFGSSVKYVNSTNLKFVNLESSFGNLTVYFDEAKLSEGSVHISVENSFGKMSLFVPKEWDTNVNVDRAFGNVSEIGRPTRESEAKVYIEGETNFGQLEINYI